MFNCQIIQLVGRVEEFYILLRNPRFLQKKTNNDEMFSCFSKKPSIPTYLHTSRVDDDPVPVTKSKIHSHWEQRKPGNIFSQCLHLVSTGYSDVQVLKTKLCFYFGLIDMEMMMKKELAEKLIPINSDSHYGKRRHIGSHARKCFHKPRINPVLKIP